MRYAVYDIGSNSVKFLVAERGPEGLHVLAEKSQATRLAEDLIATAELKPTAVERTLAVLRNLKAKADALGVGASRAVATSAVRDAGNRKQFLKAAAEVLGAPLLVLSGDEEAEGVYRGIASDPAFRGDLTGIDVGGGSVEWIVGRDGKIGERMSLPVGCVRLRERFIPAYPLPREALARFLADLQAQLEPALLPYRSPGRPIVGTGGTITAAAALDLGLAEFDGARIHGHSLTLARLEQMIAELAALDLAALEKIPGLPAKRADIVVPGLAVFIASLRLLGADRITASIRGLRYGILDALMEERPA